MTTATMIKLFKYETYKHFYLFILLLFTVIVFSQGITRSFSSDDYVHLENNIHFENVIDALTVFTHPFGREYRPLVRLSLWINHQMGDSAIPFKITNLVLHLICVVLVYALLLRLGSERTVAIVASSIFALHPIHTTSVHFILGRTDLVASVFYLATLVSIADWRERVDISRYLITFTLFLGALCSKEMSITLPIFMLAILILKQKKITKYALLDGLKKLSPFFLIAAVYLLIRVALWNNIPGAINVYTNFSPLNIIVNYFEWCFGLLYPFDLYVAKEWQILHPLVFLGTSIICCTLVLIGLIALWRPTCRSLMREPLFWFGIVWIILILLPMSGGSSHRWYLYLPSAGLSLLFVAAWKHLPHNRRPLLAMIIGLVLLIFSVETARQSYIWKKQSVITETFLDNVDDLNLHKLQQVDFANIPFGYKGAFLFTHSSLQEAIQVRHGYSPKIRVLSYLNMGDNTLISAEPNANGIAFSVKPNAYIYFMMSAAERRFNAIESRSIDEYMLTIDELDNGGRIKRYTLRNNDNTPLDLYYFDGTSIKKIPN